MNFLHLIYAIGIFFIGSIVGVVIEYFVDVDILKDIQNENRTLRLKLEDAEKVDHLEIVERVEIAEPKDTKGLDFTQEW